MGQREQGEKKGGFLRRLSLAANSRPQDASSRPVAPKSALEPRAPLPLADPRPRWVARSSAGAANGVGGPTYSSLPSGAAPSAFSASRSTPQSTSPDHQPGHNPADNSARINQEEPAVFRHDRRQRSPRRNGLGVSSHDHPDLAAATSPLAPIYTKRSSSGQLLDLATAPNSAQQPAWIRYRDDGSRGSRTVSAPLDPSQLRRVAEPSQLPGRASSGSFTSPHMPVSSMPIPSVSPRAPSTGSSPTRHAMASSSQMAEGGIGPRTGPLDSNTRSDMKHSAISSRKILSATRAHTSSQQSLPIAESHSMTPKDSEASAYAKLVAHNRIVTVQQTAEDVPAVGGISAVGGTNDASKRNSLSVLKSEHRMSRPLPKPPLAQPNRISLDGYPKRESGEVSPSRSTKARGDVSLSPSHPRLTVVIPETKHGAVNLAEHGTHKTTHRVSLDPSPSFIDFARSPTLPPLIDPRSRKDQSSHLPPALNPIEAWARAVEPRSPDHGGLSPFLASDQFSTRQTVSALPTTRVHSATAETTNGPHVTSLEMETVSSASLLPPAMHESSRPQRAGLRVLMSIPRIQSAVLANLSINSFLSLTGASDSVRRLFSGETVGRWVMTAWNIQVDREMGRSWPNLTVWEGFLESLLHDPATYSTYPPQWHNLLQHLSLSHSLIVLQLRSLPVNLFPHPAPLPFETDQGGLENLPSHASFTSLPSQARPASRVGSVAGSETGSLMGLGKMPKPERVVELVMPTPLAGEHRQSTAVRDTTKQEGKLRRRGSAGSIATASIASFGRRRTNSMISGNDASVHGLAVPVPQGKAAPPPVSFPTAKRYGFRRTDGVGNRSRRSSESGRPGSIYSAQSSPALSARPQLGNMHGSIAAPSPSVLPNSAGVALMGGSKHTSVMGSDTGHSSRISDIGRESPITSGKRASPSVLRRNLGSNGPIEPAFERPPPYVLGRAPLLRVFVPLSVRMPQWPSAEAAKAAVRELDKCGASRRMRLGDLVINTAIRHPRATEHVLLFVPYVKHLLVPLEYRYSSTGHLPAYVDAFAIPPSYYYPFLPPPQIVYLNLAPFCARAFPSVRLAFDRRDVTVASGQRIVAKRFLHVAGFEVTAADHVASEWRGMVSLEAEGTAEGKNALEHRLGHGNPAASAMAPWEVIREKSMGGNVWLRLVKISSTSPL